MLFAFRFIYKPSRFYSFYSRMSSCTKTASDIETPVIEAWKSVSTRIEALRSDHSIKKSVTLVAVSKTKPTELIQALYDNGQRHFGENYVQELVEKAEMLSSSCPDINWHFIGHLQSNKVKLVQNVERLAVIETVDNLKLATKLDVAWAKRTSGTKLQVFLQVNTSGEDSKSGVSPHDCVELASAIVKLSNVELAGLMTIGAPGNSENDFDALVECRTRVESALQLENESLELSMGMSSDYETAIKHGATNVRVGSTIFGGRAATKNTLNNK